MLRHILVLASCLALHPGLATGWQAAGDPISGLWGSRQGAGLDLKFDGRSAVTGRVEYFETNDRNFRPATDSIEDDRGEIGWAPGWWPRYVTPADGEPREGGVWLTEQEGQEVIWRVERFDRAAGAAEYLRITPGNRLVTVEVDCRPSGEHTAAIVRYRAIALSESGRQWLDGFTEEHYTTMMAEWETLIAAHLAAR